MDIQEREAFENALQKRHKNILRWVMWVESIQKYVMSPKTERHDDVYAEKAYRKIQDFLYAWQAAKAVPEGFVLVEKKNTEDWYLDESEGMWFDHDGIDGGLCELDIGEVQAVEHKEYLITESNTLYATKVWNEENQDVDCWTLFKTEEEANKAAAYCKAKFNDEPIEAQEQKG